MKKRILFISEMYLPGGLERVLIDLLSALDPAVFEAHLLLKAPGLTDRLRRALPAHVTIHEPAIFAVQAWQESLGRSALPAPLKLIPRALLRILKDLSFFLNIAVLGGHIKRIDPAAVEIINGGYPGGMVCLAAAVAAQRRAVPWIDLYILSMPLPRRFGFVDRLVDGWVAKAVDRISANCAAACKDLEATRGMPREKLRTIYTGLPEEPAGAAAAGLTLARQWRTYPEGKLIGMLSVFVPNKGHSYLLQAAAAIAQRFPTARWILAGDGPERDEIIRQANDLGLKDRVLFPGRYAGPSHEATAALDIVVHPSLQEGFPYAVLEAMRAGKPIIATGIAGIPEQIEDGVSGLLVKPADTAALAAAMTALLEDPRAAAGYGAAAKRRFDERFSLSSMREAFVASYANVAGAGA